MKKFAIKAVALAAGALAAGGVLAGTITVPGGQHNFAVEALSPVAPLTAVTTPTFVYNMGVGRPAGNGFTIINSASSGSTFGTCVIPTYAPVAVRVLPHVAPTVFITLKRSGVELNTGLFSCVYDVQVSIDDIEPTDTFTWTGQTFATHPLATAGSNIALSMNLKDPGETAQVDNPGPISQTLAASGHALTLTAAQDTGTTTDVNHPNGPLFGFVDKNDDTASTARASFLIGNNSGATTYVMPNGVTPWSFTDTDGAGPITQGGTAINLTVSGNFGGMATNGLTVSSVPGPVPVVSGTGGTRTFTLLPANIHSGANSVSVSFLSAQTASLGTSRTFGVSGVGDVAVPGADVTLAGNANWWVWDANASQLVSTFFNTNPNYITRFFFLNTGSTAVGYSVQCYTEGGNAVSNGVGGTLAAAATTNLTASSICTFPAGTPRGAVVFTINTRIGDIKGTFQQISPTGADGVVQPLVRPYGNNYNSDGKLE